MNFDSLEKKQFSHNFKYSIERVWILVKNIPILSFIYGETDCHPIFINGTNNIIGSEFIGILFGKFPYNGKIEKLMEIPGYKKIKWILNFENGGFFTNKLELFKVTEDNTTILLVSFKENIIFKEMMKILTENEETKRKKIIEKLENVLKESSIDLVQYESGIISGSMEDIWEFMTNISKLKMIAPLIRLDGDDDLKFIKCGDILVCKLENNTIQINVQIFVINKNEKWNKWIYGLNISKNNSKIPSQKIIVELTKINQKDCQLIILNKFNEYTDNDYIQKISKEKKYIINSIKDYLENYKN